MKSFTHFTLAALVASATAYSVNLKKRESPLSIVLTKSGNTEVKVAVTNNGNKTLNLLSKGTFLDEVSPVEKVSVFSNSGSEYVHTQHEASGWGSLHGSVNPGDQLYKILIRPGFLILVEHQPLHLCGIRTY